MACHSKATAGIQGKLARWGRVMCLAGKTGSGFQMRAVLWPSFYTQVPEGCAFCNLEHPENTDSQSRQNETFWRWRRSLPLASGSRRGTRGPGDCTCLWFVWAGPWRRLQSLVVFFFFFEGQDFPLVIGEPWVTRQKKKTVLDERREGKQGDKRGGRSLSTVDNENP